MAPTMNRTYCLPFVTNGCPRGHLCRLRHDIRKCSCGLVIIHKNFLPHIRGKRHQKLLQQKRREEHEAAQRSNGANVHAGLSNAQEIIEICQNCGKALTASEIGPHKAEHLRQQHLAEIRAELEEAERNKEGIKVACEDGVDFGVLEAEEEYMVELLIAVNNTNTSSSVALQSCRMRSSTRNDEYGKTFSARLKGKSKLIHNGQSRFISIVYHPADAGRYEDTLELVFVNPQPRRTFIITRRILATVGSREDHEQLRARAPYVERKTIRTNVDGEIIPSLRPPTWTATIWAEWLPHYKAPDHLITAAFGPNVRNHKTAIKGIRRCMPATFDVNTHGKWFQTLLHVEEEQMRLDLDAYSLKDATLEATPPRYALKVEGLAENRPSVLVGDFILVSHVGSEDANEKRKWYEGRVHQVHQNHVTLRFSDSFSTYRGTKFDVKFVLNRLPLRRMHHALNNSFKPARVLFPGPEHVAGLRRVTAAQRSSFVPIYRPLREDEEQMETIAAIVNQDPGSVPFVVFGPPGTGKTVTIVEAMQQILLLNPEARILACAPNNSAADLIAQKLVNLGKSQIFRLNALSRKISELPTMLDDFALINGNEVFAIPTVEVLAKYRVVVSTCLSGGVPAQLGIKRGHYTHIFIDEAGQGKEPEVLIPIKSIADANTNIILAGDNQQLGPVVHSPFASTLGLKTSYLARIMDRDIYSLDSRSPGGRGINIVKLVKNFRSHPDILEFSNSQFYGSELECCGDPAMTHSLENYEELPKKRFPIIFHSINGKDQRESSSPSFFNIDEATQVKKYCLSLVNDRKNGIRAGHIGVITPYHAQRCKILDLFRKEFKLSGIKVGSVEEFQGQERRIIVLSTVRSNTEFVTSDIRRSLGFVANGRRFNVAVTRAQALLIVIGNPTVLSLDPLWRAFLNYIYLRGGWKGKKIDWDPDDPVNPPSGSQAYDRQRKTQAEIEMEETIQRLRSLIMHKHEDSDFEIDDGDDSDSDVVIVERPILREAE
ncbi:P-loop containing nucleoside triphosphate hydrolase protein [Crucibulum laeve]|uniref:RNA helicase n=1 Tax=Crucibulum laeve TaxID=68775 RepID=A0A5C3M7H9_9AGAR|nr:P-loop containing nucleoside triphosphate hydrolase protein [Crucibulum laeve]